MNLIRFAIFACCIAILGLTYLLYQQQLFLSELAEDQVMILELIIEWLESNGYSIPDDKPIET